MTLEQVKRTIEFNEKVSDYYFLEHDSGSDAKFLFILHAIYQ